MGLLDSLRALWAAQQAQGQSMSRMEAEMPFFRAQAQSGGAPNTYQGRLAPLPGYAPTGPSPSFAGPPGSLGGANWAAGGVGGPETRAMPPASAPALTTRPMGAPQAAQRPNATPLSAPARPVPPRAPLTASSFQAQPLPAPETPQMQTAQPLQDPRRPNMMAGLEDALNNPLFQTGVALYANSFGDPQNLSQDLARIGATAREQQRLDNEQRRLAAQDARAERNDTREAEQFAWERERRSRPETVVEGGFVWRRDPATGTVERVGEVPLNAAQRAEVENRFAFTPTQVRTFGNAYDSAQRGFGDDFGILRPSLPYATAIVQAGGQPEALQQRGVANVRMSDVALLRAAARAQTGPGVLTESEVLGTLSPSLQQRLVSGASYLDIGRQGITPEDRLALANFVQLSARNTQRQMWDNYDDTLARLESARITPQQAGIRAPRVPHPDDMGQLNSPDRTDYVPGREYTTRSGRQYRFVGPGNWEYVGMGRYVPGNRNPAQGSQAPAQTQQPAQQRPQVSTAQSLPNAESVPIGTVAENPATGRRLVRTARGWEPLREGQGGSPERRAESYAQAQIRAEYERALASGDARRIEQWRRRMQAAGLQ